ncbi:EmrB/QacA subfamily drug resistance transporter [Chitinophaga dinghuensis]|uniref:EmrB/QacA subfamily drug resistance transporter n=1 Tax=Chitinophaga dinghuensis TaxID=1539050 RepID=A0A327VK60_9BACT|nr:MFS transporter [Chitinophaga dinghuensis]RAJ75104.1 EmrB/QacA subfamily drug resistance transporter [Chitinophaga dinghuensis]
MDAIQSAYSTRRWLILAILSAGAFLSPLDFIIVNVALADIKTALHASETALQLVVAGYGLTYAVLVVTGGRLGDIYGRKKVFMSGMMVFTFASACCASAKDINWLIAARVLQGMGAAMLAPQVIATIRVIFPPTEQPKAMGIFGAVFGLAVIAGQLLGGILIDAHLFGWTWESVFMVNLPVGLICCTMAYFFMEENQAVVRPKLDIGGIVLATICLLLFIYPLVKGREAHWPLWVFMSVLLSGVTGWLLFRYEERLLILKRSPLLHTPLLRNVTFLKGAGVVFLYNHTAAIFLIFPYYLQNGLHKDAFDAGMAVLPYAIGFFIAPLVSHRFQFSGHRLIQGGLLLITMGCMLGAIALHFESTPGLLLKTGLLMAGIGHGTVMPAMLRQIMSDVDVSLAGQASGIVSTAIQVGSVTGTAVIGTLFFTLLEYFSYSRSIEISFITLSVVFFTGWRLAISYNKSYIADI